MANNRSIPTHRQLLLVSDLWSAQHSHLHASEEHKPKNLLDLDVNDSVPGVVLGAIARMLPGIKQNDREDINLELMRIADREPIINLSRG